MMQSLDSFKGWDSYSEIKIKYIFFL